MYTEFQCQRNSSCKSGNNLKFFVSFLHDQIQVLVRMGDYLPRGTKMHFRASRAQAYDFFKTMYTLNILKDLLMSVSHFNAT